MKRFNSNPDSTAQSSIIAGNLLQLSRPVDYESDEEETIDDDYSDEEKDKNLDMHIHNNVRVTIEEVEAADKILYEAFGVNLISVLIKLLLAGMVSSVDFTIQSIAYKAQSLLRGKSGVRYLKSWGIFWAAVRNIVKSRGLIPFFDHFSVPSRSQLAKYKQEAMKLCGLDKSSIGRPGLQESSLDLWVNAKSRESGGKPLCLSACMDGKKIAVSSSYDATEDMGEKSKEAADIILEELLEKMAKLLGQNDRESLFKLYDQLSAASQEIVDKVHGCEVLEVLHTKRLEKNPNMLKYIHILKSKSSVGKEVLENISSIQGQVIAKIAEKRNSTCLLPKQGKVNLETQKNFEALERISVETDRTNLYIINQHAVNEHLLEIRWPNIKAELVETYNLSRQSGSCQRLLDLCYLKSDQVFTACGLGAARPVQDMKAIYHQSHSFPSKLSLPEQMDQNVLATFCSVMAPMTFGNNCTIRESGIHIKGGVCSVPDLLVLNRDCAIEYSVQIVKPSTHVFQIDTKTVAAMVVDSFLCRANKGSLALQCNEQIMVVICVPTNYQLAEDILAFCHSYISANKAPSKRSKEVIAKQVALKESLCALKETVMIIGSYPMVHQRGLLGIEKLKSFDEVSAELVKIMYEKQRFLSKEARELIAINISDMSGNPSDSPHTLLAATYLSSNTLKVVGGKCLKDVIAFLELRNCVCLNIGVDGESLHLATSLSDGTPGTELSLAKCTLKQLQSFTKENLVRIISKNPLINILSGQDDGEETEVEEPLTETCIDSLEETLALIQEGEKVDANVTLEDIETLLSSGVDASSVDIQREVKLKSLKVSELRMICLRHIFSQVKKKWLSTNMGQDKIEIFDQNGKVDFVLSTVFQKTSKGLFRTVTFDFAHIINLFRESAATGKLENLGIRAESLRELAARNGFKYLEQIIALKNGKLKYDSMNQKAASSLFSEKTADGLRFINDFGGAKAVRVISRGLHAFDESGRGCEERIKDIINLKTLILEKNSTLQRLKRPDGKHITNELYQMVLCSIDSHISTYLNLQFFNPRRKSTSSVEMLFGQLMLMTDGCSKLGVRQLQDVLQRLALSNALRLLPLKILGFKFLGNLKRHMTSYKPDDSEEMSAKKTYPKLKLCDGTVNPVNSCFDEGKNKKRILRQGPVISESARSFDGNARKFHRKF